MPRGKRSTPPAPDGRYTGKVTVKDVVAAPSPEASSIASAVVDAPPRKAMLVPISPARPRWEYRTLYSAEEGMCWKHAGDEIDFNDLGAEGWELVTIYPVGDAMHAPVYYAVFKREKSEHSMQM